MILIPLPPDQLAPLAPLLRPFAEQMAGRFPDDWPVPEIVRQARAGRSSFGSCGSRRSAGPMS